MMTVSYLQNRLIYSIIVAGKSAKFTDAVMTRLEAHFSPYGNPFAACFHLDQKWLLLQRLKDCRTGNYQKLYKALCQLFMRKIDLGTVEPEELEAVHGIGPKTARFFIMHFVNEKARFAAPDVHVLRWMREEGYDAPKSTPIGEKYRRLEVQFIAEADKRGITPKQLDDAIWLHYSRYKGESPRP